MNENVITKDFLIPEVENKEEYTKYRVKVFRTVPVNVSLVKRNKITGVVSSCSKGLKFIFPWVASKFVSLASKTIDYPKDVYKTRDGIEVTVDFALTVKVVDPVAFETKSQNPLQEVGVLAMDLMRAHVASQDAEDFYKSTINLDSLDPLHELEDIVEDTGIEVSSIYVKNIELPQSIKDDFEKQVVASKERDIAKIKAETLKQQAKAEAEASVMKDQASLRVELERIKEVVTILSGQGYTKEQILEFLRTSQFANGTAQVIANLNGTVDNSSLGAAQMVVNAVNDNKVDKSNNQTSVKGKKR